MQFTDDWNFESFADFTYYIQNLHNQSIVSRTWLVSKIHEELMTSERVLLLRQKWVMENHQLFQI